MLCLVTPHSVFQSECSKPLKQYANCLSWFNPIFSSDSPSARSLSSRAGGSVEKVKGREFMSWDKDSITNDNGDDDGDEWNPALQVMQMRAIAHHQVMPSETLSSEPLAQFTAQYGATGFGVALGSAVPAASLLSSQPPQWWAVWGAEKVSTCCKQRSAITETSLCEPQFPAQIHNATPYLLLWRKWALSQPKPEHYYREFFITSDCK